MKQAKHRKTNSAGPHLHVESENTGLTDAEEMAGAGAGGGEEGRAAEV